MISISIQFAVLQKTVIPLVAEDDVIEHLDAEGLTGGLESAGNFHVVFAGGDIAGGVVVSDDAADSNSIIYSFALYQPPINSRITTAWVNISAAFLSSPAFSGIPNTQYQTPKTRANGPSANQ
jgi:hypothetical protein